MHKQLTSAPNAGRPCCPISHGCGLTGSRCPLSTTVVEDATMGHSTAKAKRIWSLHHQGCQPRALPPCHRQQLAMVETTDTVLARLMHLALNKKEFTKEGKELASSNRHD
ncbi:Os08g0301200 [Oryza sativa Japonica Group]|uniref:Os08g0301200 protein n=6 Tax=Oryza TaxID=4527 RepID=A0A0P0XE46_ORYSJ|nr:Os08g0301200 [Oryza sativa Japonica Group]